MRDDDVVSQQKRHRVRCNAVELLDTVDRVNEMQATKPIHGLTNCVLTS